MPALRPPPSPTAARAVASRAPRASADRASGASPGAVARAKKRSRRAELPNLRRFPRARRCSMAAPPRSPSTSSSPTRAQRVHGHARRRHAHEANEGMMDATAIGKGAGRRATCASQPGDAVPAAASRRRARRTSSAPPSPASTGSRPARNRKDGRDARHGPSGVSGGDPTRSGAQRGAAARAAPGADKRGTSSVGDRQVEGRDDGGEAGSRRWRRRRRLRRPSVSAAGDDLTAIGRH